MRKLFYFIVIPIFLFSFDYKKEFLNKNYKNVCKRGVLKINSIKDENLKSLIGIACLKSDNIFYLPYVANSLKKTKEGRLNSIYFSVIFLQKKLLYSYMMDGIDISYYKTPMTDYVLSVVVNNISLGNFKKENNKIIINYKNKKYIVYKEDDKVIVEVYENSNLIKTHWYR